MAKSKVGRAVYDLNQSRLGAVKKNSKPKKSDKIQNPPIQLTLANAPIFAAKFLEGVVIELKRLNEKLEKIKNG